MELDNFYLDVYDSTNIDHKTVIIKLNNDKAGNTYLGNLEYQVQVINKEKFEHPLNNAYIAYYNDIPVGYASIKYQNDAYEVTYGIIPEYRGEHLGALLLQEFADKLFEENPNLEKLNAFINTTNTSSKKSAILAGFNREKGIKYTQHR